jgi:hypothetical protein
MRRKSSKRNHCKSTGIAKVMQLSRRPDCGLYFKQFVGGHTVLQVMESGRHVLKMHGVRLRDRIPNEVFRELLEGDHICTFQSGTEMIETDAELRPETSRATASAQGMANSPEGERKSDFSLRDTDAGRRLDNLIQELRSPKHDETTGPGKHVSEWTQDQRQSHGPEAREPGPGRASASPVVMDQRQESNTPSLATRVAFKQGHERGQRSEVGTNFVEGLPPRARSRFPRSWRNGTPLEQLSLWWIFLILIALILVLWLAAR